MGQLAALSAARFVRPPRTLSRGATTGTVVLVRGGAPLVLNGSASLVWDLLDAPRTVDEIVDALARSTGTDVARLHADVRTVLAELIARRAVNHDDPEPG